METVNKLIAGFITLMLAAILIGVVATEGYKQTSKLAITNESLSIAALRSADNGNLNVTLNTTIAKAPNGWKSEDCPITSLVVRNASGATLTITTDYVFTASDGKIAFQNTGALNASKRNTTQLDYIYCGDDYMNQSWGRSTMNMIAGFLALIALAAGVGMFYSAYKDFKQ